MSGQIVDATLVPAPKQRNTDGEKEAVKAGKSAKEIWPDHPNKAAQKDSTHTEGSSQLKSERYPRPAYGKLTFQSDLLVTRRNPRDKLSCMERTRRSALDHYVNWVKRMGASVLSSARWYYRQPIFLKENDQKLGQLKWRHQKTGGCCPYT